MASTCVQTATVIHPGNFLTQFLTGPNGGVGPLATKPAEASLMDSQEEAKGPGNALDMWTREKRAAGAKASRYIYKWKWLIALGMVGQLMSSALCPQNTQNGLNGLHAPKIVKLELRSGV